MLIPKILLLCYVLTEVINPDSGIHRRIINAVVFLMFIWLITTNLSLIFMCALMVMIAGHDLLTLFKDTVKWIRYLKIAVIALFSITCIYLAVI